MDELAHDLSVALQESSKELQQTVRRHNRKRKGKVRRNSHGMVEEVSLYSVDFPNRSEASGGSDLDVTLKPNQINIQPSKYRDSRVTSTQHQNNNSIRSTTTNVEVTTDSEDQYGKLSTKLSALTFPNSSSLVSGADLESDSLNELHSEKKSTNHARRRRRAKLNASPSIVAGSLPDDILFTPENERRTKPRPHARRKEVMDTENMVVGSHAASSRKRDSHRMEAEPSADCLPCVNTESVCFDVSSESSLLTSEGEETCDERAGEADDEHSDFFHEINDGPTYGIPVGIGFRKPHNSSCESASAPSKALNLQHIHGSYPSISSSLPNKLKRAKYGKYGRQIRTGYRRLKSGAKTHQSSDDLSQEFLFPTSSLSFSCPEYRSAKRRRKYVPNTSPSINDHSDWQFCGDAKRSSSPGYRITSNNGIALINRRRRRPPLALAALNSKKPGTT